MQALLQVLEASLESVYSLLGVKKMRPPTQTVVKLGENGDPQAAEPQW